MTLLNPALNFPPLTWFDLGAWIAIGLVGLALLVGVTGFLCDRQRVRHRAAVGGRAQ